MDKTVLSLRRRLMAKGTRGASTGRGKEARSPQRRVVPHVQRRSNLYARQVGVSLVCGVGPRFSHDRSLPCRLRLRQRAALDDVAKSLLPPKWPNTGLRMEL